MLIIKDPEIIKQIAIQDFGHFTDHRDFVKPELDLLWSRNLLASKGERWRDLRQLLSPIFTSSKIKTMYKLMTEAAIDFIEHFNARNEDVIELDIKKVFTRYTNDVIATTAFGVKVDSLNEPNNTFYSMGQKLTNLRGILNLIKFVLLPTMPKICKYLGIKFLNPTAAEYFHEVVNDTIKAREENQIVRQDLIHLLLEARKNQSDVNPKRIVEISNTDITSQALIFFFAGFDTAASAMSFGCYELAVNKDIQDRLREEVMQVAKNGRVTYESLQEMKYMDMVLSEILRKWPPFPDLDRVCTKSYTIESIHIKKGQHITVPILSIQRDPKYFPNPDKFDPKRFSDENKHSLVPYSSLAFGLGPRMCIGRRFAETEIKALLFNLLLNYEIVMTSKTVKEAKLTSDNLLDMEGGFHLGLKRIKPQ
ncbi:unnamed protein product [Ceutorhynchus assimilis]|uniref:Cytochrome P450 n=1 Tax=Ceutorhynchus assimilis TaxID=467358 RepID=A0A9P0DMI5_9CUCU|nr:unnamed protein product [Ceutorhynchus assimilis]